MKIQALDKFVDSLVDDKGLGNLEAEVLEQVKKDLKSRVEDRINAVILEKMPPEKLEEFEKLLDKGGEEKVYSFCQVNISGLDEILAGELLRFRQTYLG